MDKDFKHKFDACIFNSDKDKVKIHDSKEQSFKLCHNFDKNYWTQKDSCKKKYEGFSRCEIQREMFLRRSPGWWFIDSSSSVSSSRAGVLLPAVSLLGARLPPEIGVAGA